MQQFFEWDEAKERSNYRKHGVLFEEAAQVFDDPLAVTEQDRIAGGELRWQTIGMGCSRVFCSCWWPTRSAGRKMKMGAAATR